MGQPSTTRHTPARAAARGAEALRPRSGARARLARAPAAAAAALRAAARSGRRARTRARRSTRRTRGIAGDPAATVHESWWREAILTCDTLPSRPRLADRGARARGGRQVRDHDGVVVDRRGAHRAEDCLGRARVVPVERSRRAFPSTMSNRSNARVSIVQEIDS